MQTPDRHVKNLLYSQVARIGKAVCSPKRLELIELLCRQGEEPVEWLLELRAALVKRSEHAANYC